MLERLWIYQRERFPLGALSLLSLMLGAATTMFSALAAGTAAPPAGTIAAAAASALLVFLQMRILDEFKDFEDDARFRPYRPVPRGLVSISELRGVLAAAALAQLAIALAVDLRLLWLLAALWGYLFLMTMEFFVREWLRARPFAYIASHNPFGALIALYASAFEWLPRSGEPQPALALLALVALFDTSLLEIGRKIRAPRDEEPGVVTYSGVWGRPTAAGAWLGVFFLVVVLGWLAARQTGYGAVFAALMAPLGVAAGIVCWRYLQEPETRRAKAIEGLSGVATLVLYAALGPVPLLLQA